MGRQIWSLSEFHSHKQRSQSGWTALPENLIRAGLKAGTYIKSSIVYLLGMQFISSKMPLYSHHPRLDAQYYLGRRYCFVTICCWQRKLIFIDLALGQQILSL